MSHHAKNIEQLWTAEEPGLCRPGYRLRKTSLGLHGCKLVVDEEGAVAWILKSVEAAR